MNDSIDNAFRNISRAEFLPEDVRHKAALDMPLPIGFGQTNSQPSTVRLLLEWLEPEPGNKVLDVGGGSGWTAALLAYLVGPAGEIYSVEKIPELLAFSRDNCERIGIGNASFFAAGETLGLPSHAPYDRILVSADAYGLPVALVDQLAVHGKMVIPVQSTVLEISKLDNGDLDIKPHPDFAFVPLET